ncbi:PepSY-associated TM helix domain-containing protein [Anditalea andensis]|uniref:Peptidase M4 n=1 Tax=Anditalea andensis TaxID=1048983 RepID=A0A074KQC9_9BACT|nr:PepSY-associated TM helix domain-containing protein [Anditalea andensis]KEO72136.1 peptidase M4 [Anditalea andensis]
MKTFKKTIGILHLWLGLISGLLVFIIALTGCIYVFQVEIQELTQPYRFTETQDKAFLAPSEIQKITDQELPGKHLHAVMYNLKGKSAHSIYFSYEDHYYDMVYVNPYSGEVLKVKDEYATFFRFIFDGHNYLWLPEAIGRPIVASATLVFFVLLISGIVLWWPKNSAGKRAKFTIKWNGSWRRKNYDLHSVIGFYASWLAIVLVFTGLIYGFDWFRNGFYMIASGGEDYVDYYTPASDHSSVSLLNMPAIDQVFYKMLDEYPDAEWIEVHPPEYEHSAIAANANPEADTYWKVDYRYFDQYTMEELDVDHFWNKLEQSSSAEMFLRMNYDIHVGAILGMPGKILAFLLSLTIASMPVTGVLLWYGRNNKKKKKSRNIYDKEKMVKV